MGFVFSINRATVAAVFVAALMAGEGPASAQDLSGTWEYCLLGHRLEVHANHRGEAIDGVAYLHSPLGKVDTYHFRGTVQDGKVVASHHDGHMFRGEIVSVTEVRGVLETSEGERLTVRARKR